MQMWKKFAHLKSEICKVPKIKVQPFQKILTIEKNENTLHTINAVTKKITKNTHIDNSDRNIKLKKSIEKV